MTDLKFDENKLEVRTTKTIRVTYNNGQYDLGTIHMDDKDRVIRIEYYDYKGDYIRERDPDNMSADGLVSYFFSCFQERIEKQYEKLIQEHHELAKLKETFV